MSHGVSLGLFIATIVAIVVLAVGWGLSLLRQLALERKATATEREKTDTVLAELEERRLTHPYSESDKKLALAGSRNHHDGKSAEQIAPLLPGYPHDLRDVRYFGDRFDQIAFVDDGGELTIVFLEIKTGASRPKPRQTQVREAVRNGRIVWEVVRVESGGEAHCVVEEIKGVERLPPADQPFYRGGPPRPVRRTRLVRLSPSPIAGTEPDASEGDRGST